MIIDGRRVDFNKIRNSTDIPDKIRRSTIFKQYLDGLEREFQEYTHHSDDEKSKIQITNNARLIMSEIVKEPALSKELSYSDVEQIELFVARICLAEGTIVNDDILQ